MHFEEDSNIDSNENMDIIANMLKNGQKTSEENSNELNLEEIETDSAKKEKVVSGGGRINNKLGGKKVSSKHAILTYSLKGKKKKKVSDFKEFKINRHHLDSVINSGAFPKEVINQVANVL